ncbi:MAG: hypothetical protein SCI25_00090 [Desulfuromonadales bacterium]|nr:hypothetical protein [Desulfuromonadales bacterium]
MMTTIKQIGSPSTVETMIAALSELPLRMPIVDALGEPVRLLLRAEVDTGNEFIEVR